VLLLAVIYLLTQIRLSTARNAILDKLEKSSATLRAMLSKKVTDDITTLFTKFLETLNPAQADAAHVERELCEHVERLRQLADSFDILDKQIHSLTPPGGK
jgi:cell shape-determining protein MreC